MPVKRRRLNKQLVIEEAARLVNEVGSFEAVTLGQLAERLDIKVPSLYNHITDADGLRRDLRLYGIERLYEVLSQAAIGRANDDAIYAIADAYRVFALENPGTYPLLLAAPDASDAELVAASNRLLTLIVNVLRAYNLTDEDALHAVRALRAVLHGFVSIEMAHGYEMELDRTDSYHRLIAMYLASLNTL